MTINTATRGKLAEQAALQFLETQGLIMVRENYRTRLGEIDLIMKDGKTLVFIEVRSRSNSAYLNPVETIDQRKIQKIILAGRYFLQQYNGNFDSCRFDVVTLTGSLESPAIDWIRNAFNA